MDLAIACAEVCEELPRFEAFLVEQLRHAANTVHASIAEGNGRPTTPDYLRFLGTAKSSLNEVRSHLLYIERRYPNIAAAKVAIEHAERTSRPLQGLIKSLREKLHRERKGSGNGRDDIDHFSGPASHCPTPFPISPFPGPSAPEMPRMRELAREWLQSEKLISPHDPSIPLSENRPQQTRREQG